MVEFLVPYVILASQKQLPSHQQSLELTVNGAINNKHQESNSCVGEKT